MARLEYRSSGSSCESIDCLADISSGRIHPASDLPERVTWLYYVNHWLSDSSDRGRPWRTVQSTQKFAADQDEAEHNETHN